MWETVAVAGILILAVVVAGIWIFRDVKAGGCSCCGDSHACARHPEASEGGCRAKEPR
ncbi:MAG: hypothetical protein JXP34_18555 [Planctomycetes bacterium]|nr:hypothetical protein [Planctomycetota bacterium]